VPRKDEITANCTVLTTAELAAVRACVTHCWLNRAEIGVKPETVLLAAQAVHEPGLADAAAGVLQAIRDSETAQLNFDRALKRSA
jgi:hypothetical protein